MGDLKKPTEIIRGAKVTISQRLGVSELEASSLVKLLGGIKEVRKVNAESLKSWDDAGLKVGSEGIIEAVYITGYSDVLFNPTEKVPEPFSYAVPTACLSIR
ncbi:conserved hypothetical protein [Candidatus Roizmanbacteria bacterium]|nr:conserved hypothetical protein [Candidatus Roizmanbacteria bacterium]